MKIPCVIYRGGTSRGLFFHEADLPNDQKLREHIFLKGIGAEDASHINGLGAGTSHTSKVVVIHKSERPDVDIDYHFVQLGIGSDEIDYEGTCGNLMAATGAFAVDEGLVQTDAEADSITVNVWSVNVHKKISVHVPLHEGKAKVLGDYAMPGVKDSGAKFIVDIENPSGGKTGAALPIGPISKMTDRDLEYSFCDIVNPLTYLRAADVGVKGTELNAEVMQNETFMEVLEEVRVQSAVTSGLAPNIAKAKQHYVALPKVAYVSEPKDYETSTGKVIKKESYDILARMVSMKKMHRTFAVSGLLNIAATCLLEGTIPSEVCAVKAIEGEQVIRIGHPEGIATIRVKKNLQDESIAYVGLDRTARRIMAGDLYIPALEK